MPANRNSPCNLAAAGVLAVATAACGPSGEVAPDDVASSAAPASRATASSGTGEGCPDLGPLAETFDASGTPLVFGFRYPTGFVVRSQQPIDDGMYKIELVREAGGPAPGAISVLQLASSSASPTPPGIPTAEQVARSPALQALGESLPEPAETIEFAGQDVATFRAVTDTKVVYKFNLPDGDGYQTVDVHFYPPGGPDNCVPMMEALATEWVGQLSPRHVGNPLPDAFPATFPLPPGLGDLAGHCNLDGVRPGCSAGGTSAASVAELAAFFETELARAGYRQVEQQRPVTPDMKAARVTFEGHGCMDCYVRVSEGEGTTNVHVTLPFQD